MKTSGLQENDCKRMTAGEGPRERGGGPLLNVKADSVMYCSWL